jgi:hypothetical protein
LDHRSEVSRDVVGGRDWQRLWLFALGGKRNLNSLGQLDDPPFGDPEEPLHLAPRHLFVLSLRSQSCSSVGVGGREGSLDLAGDVELALEEARRISGEIMQRVWRPLQEIQCRQRWRRKE